MMPHTHKLAWTIGFASLLLAGLYLWRVPVSIAPVVSTDQVALMGQEIRLTLETPVATHEMQVPCAGIDTCDLTAMSALQKATERDTIAMQYKVYDGLGTLVTSIAGFENGQDGKYWVYEINGQKIPLSADQQFLQVGDHLVWKFVIPE